VTGQVLLDSYGDAGVLVAVDLVNGLAAADAGPWPKARVLAALREILALDPPSVALLRPGDVPGFLGLARALGDVFGDLRQGDLDAAAERLNGLLARHPAHPHLAKEGGRWRLHHHPADTALVPMWAATCAEAVARMVGAGHGRRFGACAASGCGRVYFDVSKNGSRRFCSTTCQNRVKAAAFRLRQGADGPRRTGRTPRRPRR